MLDPSCWVVVPWNRKHYFSATSPVRIRSLVWIFCKDFLKTHHFFFSLVLRQALFCFAIQACMKADISSSLFVNDVVTMIWFFPELCSAPWGSVTLPKVTCQCVTQTCDSTAWNCRAGFTVPGVGFQCFWNPVQILPIQSGNVRILFPLWQISCHLVFSSALFLGFQALGGGTFFFYSAFQGISAVFLWSCDVVGFVFFLMADRWDFRSFCFFMVSLILQKFGYVWC